MIYFPHCKINLGLHIVSKRPDGYHDIQTCFYPVPWTDILEVIPSSQFSFSTSGNIIAGNPDDNLCVKAYQLMRRDHQVPNFRLHLHKMIPSGAGLGGGSSDAAFTLRLLNNVFQLELDDEKLMAYCSQLGSDCAFFTQDQPMYATQRGENLQRLSLTLKGKWLVIVKPDIHVSTAEAYAGVIPAVPPVDLREILTHSPLEAWRNVLKNDFEETVFKKFPAIKSLKEKLYALGAVYASMSGSGSAVYGVFDSAPDLNKNFQGMTSWSGMLVI
jgi:4-diphosphocytidyl-2-C-methyl-D-erythritol kinase